MSTDSGHKPIPKEDQALAAQLVTFYNGFRSELDATLRKQHRQHVQNVFAGDAPIPRSTRHSRVNSSMIYSRFGALPQTLRSNTKSQHQT